ncbi:pappalysin-1-like isoform X2 [Gigantopelta aegis]|uniref:pappalysin-1-like isoform X2 n=1 Tax=Gigantopelta aegis TaxID=1735272 RepID=UPI001B88B1D6|nr:pappalysin-1-like isoform X2 [Gigantopelta aegis]
MAQTRKGIVDGRALKMPFVQNKQGTKGNRMSYVQQQQQHKQQQQQTCTNTKEDVKSHSLSRHPRATAALVESSVRNDRGKATMSSFGNSLYFSGHEVVKLVKSDKKYDGLIIPRLAFTVAFWLKPEGGQKDPLMIIELFNSCSGYISGSPWLVGIRTVKHYGKANAKLFFSLRAARSEQSTIIFSHSKFVPNRWIYVTATYSGSEMKFFINGAMVSVSHQQRGPLFSTAITSCMEIRIGGSTGSDRFYRGTFDELRLWDSSLNHVTIKLHMRNSVPDAKSKTSLVLNDNFDDLSSWLPVESLLPRVVTSDIHHNWHDIYVTTPPCGQTVCDDPEIVLSYAKQWRLRSMKSIRYRIINLMDDDGANPTVSNDQIFHQNQALVAAFAPYNISFELHVKNVKNTTLRRKLIMFGCDPLDVGDGICHAQCQHTRTGNDGGDCDPVLFFCDPKTIGNGRCDFGCNREYHQWDGGDCCQPGPDTHYTCYDPASPWRGYLGIAEYKIILNISSDAHLNIFFASTTTDQLIGLSTFPWEKNVYSIQDDTCTDHFTEHQAARMHCYLDLVYQPWRTEHFQSPVPLAPRIVSAEQISLTISWLPPFGHRNNMDEICSQCDADGSISQFAEKATSRIPYTMGNRWTPMQATGSPDAEICVPSTRAWMPESYDCKGNKCQLLLTFRWPVVPKRLTVWVTRSDGDGVKKIVLFYDDGSSTTLTNAPSYCDMPFTTTLFEHRTLTKMKILTSSPGVAIDAVEVVSVTNDPRCERCHPVTFRVFRQPRFQDRSFHVTRETIFSDRAVQTGDKYEYWIVAVSDSIRSGLSPKLEYTHGQPFCGDEQIDSVSTEECDDGNIISGDGCDVECRVEEFFHCKDSPSLCYRHEGDGRCEEFERHSSLADCGFFTPDGYRDQWAYTAVANPLYQTQACPEWVLAGPPDLSQACEPIVDKRKVWSPCKTVEEGNFWVEVFFPMPAIATEIIVYISSDGRNQMDTSEKNITVDLIKTNNNIVPVIPRGTSVDCSKRVVHIPIKHDLSQPFFQTKGARISFRSSNLSFAAVQLRSRKYLDPLTISACGVGELYNPRSGRCVAQNCTRFTCTFYLVKHATATCSGYGEGDLCQVTCDVGHRLSNPGAREVICSQGQWESPAPVLCKPVDCGRPRIPHATVSCPYGTIFKRNCTFKCNSPATKRGVDNTIECEEDGIWSAPLSSCHVMCSPIRRVLNARLLTKHCKRARQSVGTKCKFRCRKGYRTETVKSKRRMFDLACQGNGQWSTERCVRVRCPPIDATFSGLYVCTERNYVGSRCSFKCPNRSEIKKRITCKANGRWTGVFESCSSFGQIRCPTISNIRKLVFVCANWKVGSTCLVHCKLPGHEPVFWGSSSKANKEAHSPNVGDVITAVKCSGSSNWFPDPYTLKCERKCSVSSLGDGWCDAANNRYYCGWDGGDCCSSTLGAPVRPFPDTCTAKCTCRDPGAKENSSRKKRKQKKKRFRS